MNEFNYMPVIGNYDHVAIDIDNFNKEAEIAKFQKALRMVGWSILVRLYIAPATTKSGVFISDDAHNEQKYVNCVGLVVDKAPGTYKDRRYEDTSSWCDIGDWVVFPRHAGYRIEIFDTPCWVLKEDAIDGITHDPRLIKRGH
jgi:co-chaperonin GroES (HSP10)